MNSDILPKDYNQGFAVYPFYAFYIIAKLAWVLRISDPSVAFVILGLVSAIGIFLFPRLILKNKFGQNTPFIISLIIFCVITFFDRMIIHKPHELIAFEICVVLIYKYFAKSEKFTIISKRNLIVDSFLLSFTFGCQPMFAGITFLSLLIIFKLKKLNLIRELIYFVIPSVLFSVPAILPGVISSLKAKDSAAFNSDDYWIFSVLPNTFILISLVFLLIFLADRARNRELENRNFFTPPLISLSFYILLCVLAATGIILPIPPQRLVTFTAALILLSALLNYEKRIEKVKFAHNTSSASLLFNALVIFSFTSVLFLTGAPDDLLSSYSLSNARNANTDLQSAAKFLNNKGSKIALVNGEYRFIQYYSSNTKVKIVLPFNQGWSSPDMNVQSTFNSLDKVVKSGETKQLNNWLLNHKIDTIMLEGDKSLTPIYSIEVLLNVTFPRYSFLENGKIEISNQLLSDLTKFGWKFEEADCNCTYAEKKSDT